MLDPRAPDPFALAAWRTNLIAADPAPTIWLMCAIANLVYGWSYLDLIERSIQVRAPPRA